MKVGLSALCLVASLGAAARSEGGDFRCSNGIYIAASRVAALTRAREAFFANLRTARIGTVFFYGVREAEDPAMLSFIDSLRKAVPGVKIAAMVGRNACPKSGCVPIRSLREGLLHAAARYWSAGFDAVQIDVEPVASGDSDFPALLKDIRSSKPADKLLSIAGYFVDLPPALQSELKPSPKAAGTLRSWSADYYRSVAQHTDQVMVMNYDTALRSPEAYRRFTAWQVSTLRDLIPTGVEIQFGLPSDVPRRTGFFDSRSETLRAGTSGVEDALKEFPACPSAFGVTIFTEEGMKAEKDWADFSAAFARP